MSSQRRRKLDALITRFQMDYGPRALRRPEPGERTPPVQRIPTTFGELDTLLGGGVPIGCITEVIGPATSGKLTLAAKTIAAAHRERESLAAWIDTHRTCDGDYMHRCGVDLSRLLVAQPATLADALAMCLHLVESRALAALVVDALPASEPGGADAIAGAVSQLTAVLPETQTAVVFLTERRRFSLALAHAAAVRLEIRRERWIVRHDDVRGYEGHAELIKNRLGPLGSARIQIKFNGTVRGDGL